MFLRWIFIYSCRWCIQSLKWLRKFIRDAFLFDWEHCCLNMRWWYRSRSSLLVIGAEIPSHISHTSLLHLNCTLLMCLIKHGKYSVQVHIGVESESVLTMEVISGSPDVLRVPDLSSYSDLKYHSSEDSHTHTKKTSLLKKAVIVSCSWFRHRAWSCVTQCSCAPQQYCSVCRPSPGKLISQCLTQN